MASSLKLFFLFSYPVVSSRASLLSTIHLPFPQRRKAHEMAKLRRKSHTLGFGDSLARDMVMSMN